MNSLLDLEDSNLPINKTSSFSSEKLARLHEDSITPTEYSLIGLCEQLAENYRHKLMAQLRLMALPVKQRPTGTSGFDPAAAV